MHGVNRSVVERVTHWLESGDGCWYVTVLETWGASPRPPGSLFAVNRVSGKSIGSLSSGCIEQELIASWQSLENPCFPSVQRFGNSPEDTHRFELPCGGTLEVLVECLHPDKATIAHFRSLDQALRAREPVARRVHMRTGEMDACESHAPHKTLACADGWLTHHLRVNLRLLILGWGDITQYLLPIVGTLDMDVTVCEPRQDVLERSSLLERQSSEALTEMLDIRSDILPDDLIRKEFNDPHCAIIALSHDPRVDDLGLIAALESEAFFIGALGSSRTAARRRQRLSDLGLSAQSMQRIHAPVGLDIHSKTPPEIAVSIAAQLIHHISQPLTNTSLNAQVKQ